MDWVDEPQNFKGLYRILQLVQMGALQKLQKSLVPLHDNS